MLNITEIQKSSISLLLASQVIKESDILEDKLNLKDLPHLQPMNGIVNNIVEAVTPYTHVNLKMPLIKLCINGILGLT